MVDDTKVEEKAPEVPTEGEVVETPKETSEEAPKASETSSEEKAE